jgi:hypothetical protein
LSLGGSSPYTSTDKTNGNKIYINETIQKTQYKKHKKRVNTSTHITNHPHIHTPTHYGAS